MFVIAEEAKRKATNCRRPSRYVGERAGDNDDGNSWRRIQV
jgi:hypothetical protein